MARAIITRRPGTLVKNIENAEVELDFSSVTYDAHEHAPAIASVTLDGQQLRDMQDYYAVITPQTNAGEHSILIRGVGEYGGAKSVPWRIEKAQGSISLEPAEITIQGAAGTQATVKIIYTGDGEISVSESEYVAAQIEGGEIRLTSLREGSDTLSVTMADGENYTGGGAKLRVEVTFLPDYNPVFSKNSWSVIGQYCKAGRIPEEWQIGDLSPGVYYSGSYFHYRIGDFNHYPLAPSDEYYDDPNYNGGSNKAAMVLIQEEVFYDDYRLTISNRNGSNWEGCVFRISELPKIRTNAGEDFLNVVRKVVVKTAKSGTDATIVETEDDLFVMSEVEVFGNNDHSNAGEGAYLQLFQDGYTRVRKQKNGTKKQYWLRSPRLGSIENYLSVDSGGALNSALTGNLYEGIILAVCI